MNNSSRIAETIVSMFLVAASIVLLGLILSSCQTPGVKLNKHEVQERARVLQLPEFAEHIEYFEYLVEANADRTVVVFDLPKGRDFDMTGILGVCFPDLNYVAINEDRWPELGRYQQYALIAHELLHCAYGVPHRRDRIAIMNPVIHSEETLIEFWPLLIAEIEIYPNSNHQFMLDGMLPIPMTLSPVSATDTVKVNRFCSINNRGVPNGECVLTLLDCMSGYTQYQQCTEEYLLNNGYEMGVCPDPELIRNLNRRKG